MHSGIFHFLLAVPGTRNRASDCCKPFDICELYVFNISFKSLQFNTCMEVTTKIVENLETM